MPDDVRKRLRPLLLLALTGLTLSASGCAELVKRGLEAAVGPSAPDGFADGRDLPRRREAGVTNVYQHAPTPEWEVGLTPTPSAARSEYFEAQLFGGACPGWNPFGVGTGRTSDPFGPIETRSGGFFTVSTSHQQWGPQGFFNPIVLGGTGRQVQSWQALGIYGLAEGGCRAAFLPLLRFGTNEPMIVAK
jgi:hypothetical protein